MNEFMVCPCVSVFVIGFYMVIVMIAGFMVGWVVRDYLKQDD